MNIRIIKSTLLAGLFLLANSENACSASGSVTTPDKLKEVRRDIGAEAYRVEAYLRLFDQRNRLLILAGAMNAEMAVRELAAAGREASSHGVDRAFMKELVIRHKDAFSQFHTSLKQVVKSGRGKAKFARARPGYDRMMSARIDPLPLLIQLNYLWAEETGTTWQEADQFSGFTKRLLAAIPDTDIRNALMVLDNERVAAARAQGQRQTFHGNRLDTQQASTVSAEENKASMADVPLVESQPNAHIFGWGSAEKSSPPTGNPREIDTLWRSSSGSFAFPPLQDGNIEVIAMGGNEVLIGELRGRRFTGHWIQVVKWGDPLCEKEMSGSRTWGRFVIEFEPGYSNFEGRSGDCDSQNLEFTWSASRTQ